MPTSPMQPRVDGCGMVGPSLLDPELGRPLHTGDSAAASGPRRRSDGERQSAERRFLACLRRMFLRPLCCFPSAAGAPPNTAYQDEGSTRCWLPPVLGFAPIFWLTIFALIGVGVAAQYCWKPILLTSFVLLGYILSVAVHEFAHAATAYAGGDESVLHAGYLTLDYLRYASPIYSYGIPLLFILFGGVALPGAAVLVQVGSLRSRMWESLTALAGPLANALIGLLTSGFLHLLLSSKLEAYTLLHMGLACLIYFEAMSVTLSLIPLPPFDGWAAVSPWLPDGCFLKALMRHPTQRRLVQLLMLAALLPLFAHVSAIGDAVVFVGVRIFQSPPVLMVKALHYFYLPYREWVPAAARAQTFPKHSVFEGVPLETDGV